MPDTGDFGKDSAAASPASWGDAFAALPLETADGDGWQRLQARLPAAASPRVRVRWPLWLAAAASLGLVVALPLRMSHETAIESPALATDQTSSQDAVAGHPGARRDPALVADAIRHDEEAASRVPASSDREGLDPGLRRDDGSTLASGVAARSGRKHSTMPRIAPAQRPIRTAAESAGTTRLAETTPSTPTIEALHAESAQLEELLAMVRDDRMLSATSAALSSDLDARIASIDDALAQPGLDAADRDRLWQRRVDALQQLVGIETTNRLLSARGEQFNASLVSID
jgi:hypothetical protein